MTKNEQTFNLWAMMEEFLSQNALIYIRIFNIQSNGALL